MLSIPPINFYAIRYPSQLLSNEAILDADFAHDPIVAHFTDMGVSRELISRAFFGAMMQKERWFLEKMYAEELGIPEARPYVHFRDLEESLAADYRMFGLATGKHAADVLLRQLSMQAIAQARAAKGKSL